MTILSRKQPHFNVISPDSPVSEALYRMCNENVDFLIVLSDENYLGVLSTQDITSKIMTVTQPLNSVYVKDLMNTGLPVSNSDDTIEHCMMLMRQFNVRYLPVFEGISFKGVLSSDDIIQEAVLNRFDIFDPEREEPAAYA